jgi:hypothetical protein
MTTTDIGRIVQITDAVYNTVAAQGRDIYLTVEYREVRLLHKGLITSQVAPFKIGVKTRRVYN